jgi:hypothetical protein
MDDKKPYKPTWRKPFGILALMLALFGYSLVVVGLSSVIGKLPVLVQALVYIILGTLWLLPLRRFLIWMETGRWG